MSSIYKDYPSPIAIEAAVIRRGVRKSQRKSRGGKVSYRDEAENLAIMLAFSLCQVSAEDATRAVSNGKILPMTKQITNAATFGARLARALSKK